MRSRLVALIAAVLTLLLVATASAGPPSRIVQGQQAAQGEYPAQGWLRVDTAGSTGYDFSCGGTLVGSRQFLTAAHCAVDFLGNPLPASGFNVRLGNVDKRVNTDEYTGVALAVHPDYASDFYGNSHDVAMLTLNRPANYEPMPVVERAGESLWRPEVAGTLLPSRIIGWGTTSSGAATTPNFLLENANVVPMRTDAACSAAYQDWQGAIGQNGFDATTMVCAGDGNGDTCQGDSGGPLMVGDGGGGLVLVGVTSFGEGCNEPDFPGVYSRLGSEPLNSWVHDRTPRADFTISGSQRATEPVSFNSRSTHPEGPGYYTSFLWDFDGDGAFDDGSGASTTHAFPSPGEVGVGLQASKPGGDKAEAFYRVAIGAAPGGTTGTPTTSTSTTATPTTATPTTATPTTPVVAAPPRLATLLLGRGAQVDRRGRFGVRINFGPLAPVGKNAVVTVKNGSVKLGSAKVRVARGKSVRAKVQLTKSGLRRLRKARKLKVTVRLALGTTVQTKTVTLKTR